MNKQTRIRAVFTIILSAMLIFSLAACGKKEPKKEEKKTSKASAAEKQEKRLRIRRTRPL